MSASQDLPVTGAPAAAIGLIGALSLAVGTALVAVANLSGTLRRRSR